MNVLASDKYLYIVAFAYFLLLWQMKNAYSEKWIKKYLSSYQRYLLDISGKIDFASNDYLGFAAQQKVKQVFLNHSDKLIFQGSTGSRLISGNTKWIEEIEAKIAEYHFSEAAIIFPSAYQANVGLLSCIADRNDLYLIDEHIHASVYDGIRLSFAKHFKFKHNDIQHLKKLLDRNYSHFENIYVIVETLYSMDGDSPDIMNLLELIDNKKVFLIADEAHSFGISGEKYLGLLNTKSFSEKCAARIIAYGKALGFSGAAVVGSEILKKYLINFCRSFIFSTALPLYHYQAIFYLYQELIYRSESEQRKLKHNIQFYLSETGNDVRFSKNNSPIQYYSVSGLNFSDIQQYIFDNNLFAKLILPPTINKGSERVRISLHSFNTEKDIVHLINTLKKYS